MIVVMAGCGRTSGNTTHLDTKADGDLEFSTVQKSIFIPGHTNTSGHYRMVVKTLHKPEIYAQDDALAKAEYYQLIENGKHKEESRVAVEKSNNEVESKVMLLLDLSGSIIEGGCNQSGTTCNQLIRSANDFVSKIIQNGQFEIAIYYFNAKREIMPLSRQVEYPSANVTILQDAINQLRDNSFIEQYLKGYDNSTNLYGAVKQSGEKVCSWIDCDTSENFEIGSVVVFTDGRDLAEIVSKEDMLKSLQKNLQYYTIGIGDADNKTLIQISGEAHHFEATQDNIEDAFTQAYNDILYNSSFYRIRYCPSTLEGKVRIRVKFEDSENHIRAYTEEEQINLSEHPDLRCDLY